MENTLLTTGLTCVIAALVGGGLKAFGIEVPLLKSGYRQLGLGLFGILLIVAAARRTAAAEPKQEPAATTSSRTLSPEKRSKLFAELEGNNERIADLQAGLAKHNEQRDRQEQRISEQEAAIQRGEGTPQSVDHARAIITSARAAISEANAVDARAHEFIGNKKRRNAEIQEILGAQ